MSTNRLPRGSRRFLSSFASGPIKIGLVSTATFCICSGFAAAQEKADGTPSKQLPPVTVQTSSKAPVTTKKKRKGQQEIKETTTAKAEPIGVSGAADMQFIPIEGTVLEGYRVSSISDVGPFGRETAVNNSIFGQRHLSRSYQEHAGDIDGRSLSPKSVHSQYVASRTRQSPHNGYARLHHHHFVSR